MNNLQDFETNSFYFNMKYKFDSALLADDYIALPYSSLHIYLKALIVSSQYFEKDVYPSSSYIKIILKENILSSVIGPGSIFYNGRISHYLSLRLSVTNNLITLHPLTNSITSVISKQETCYFGRIPVYPSFETEFLVCSLSGLLTLSIILFCLVISIKYKEYTIIAYNVPSMNIYFVTLMIILNLNSYFYFILDNIIVCHMRRFLFFGSMAMFVSLICLKSYRLYYHLKASSNDKLQITHLEILKFLVVIFVVYSICYFIGLAIERYQ